MRTYTGQDEDWTENAMSTMTETSMGCDLHRSGGGLDRGLAEHQVRDLDERQDEDLDEP